FQKIFVLNLPSRTDRRDSMSLAAALSILQIEYIDGVAGDDVLEKVLPPNNHKTMAKGNIGSWRAHMNALLTIVEQNISTALILEDDADWDVRIKRQLETFATAALGLQISLNNSNSTTLSHLRGDIDASTAKGDAESGASISISALPRLHSPKSSPYGLEWDILWLGHCGAQLPFPSPASRIAIFNDETVPEPQHLKSHPFAPHDAIASVYPPHTRVVHRSNKTICSIAYAVTQGSARKLLWEFGIRGLDRGYDFALRDWCDGVIGGVREEKKGEGGRPMCITVQPPLFSHYFPPKATSDIMGHGGGYVAKVESKYLRWSVKMNLGRLVWGREVVDQWPDGEGKMGKGV
ncbi:hypothetical protein BU16DRAFT_465319, partial [Lophium mytilinum]